MSYAPLPTSLPPSSTHTSTHTNITSQLPSSPTLQPTSPTQTTRPTTSETTPLRPTTATSTSQPTQEQQREETVEEEGDNEPLSPVPVYELPGTLKLPEYAEVGADRVPSYFETIVVTNPGLTDGLFSDGLPVGSPLVFLAAAIITMIFHLPGFIITYWLSESHAGRKGATAGLGLIFAQLSFSSNLTDDMHIWVGFAISLWGWMIFFTSAVKYNQARNIAAFEASMLGA